MATTIKGHVACPECNSTQPVKHDGRKYFINCAECRTFTSYQSKAAQARLLNKLTPVVDKAEQPEEKAQPPQEKSTPKIHKPVNASDSVFDLF